MSELVSLAHDRRGAGPALVLISGTGYPRGTWPDELVERLTERHTVVTFDHRGTGSTPGTPDRYTTRLFAADVVRLLDELDIPNAHLVGHSMGGRVAQWIALDAPERVRTLVLAASGPGSFDADRPQSAGIPVATALRLVELGYEEFVRTQIRTTFFTDAFAAEHPERVARLADAFWEHRPSLEDYLKHVAARQEHRTTERLAEIGQPALVLIGDEDTHVGGTGSHWEQSQYLASRLPNAELRVVGGARHGFFWSHTAEVAALLVDWLARHDATGRRAA